MFPDTERALAELIGAAIPGALVGAHLPADFTDHLPAVQVNATPAPGQLEPFERTDRAVIDVYAPSRPDGKAAAEAIRAAIVGRGHATSHGLLDDVYVETEPAETPFGGDLAFFTATYRVDVRASA